MRKLDKNIFSIISQIISKNNMETENVKPLTDFDSNVVKFVLQKEGGLSNNLNDSASNYPSPTPEKYHTNKGITYKNFVEFADKLGYKASLNNFLTMPLDIWLKIFNLKYLKPLKNISDNKVLNTYLGLWLWGGWSKKHVTMEEVKNILNSNSSNRQKLADLVELRKIYFKKVVAAIPKNKVFLTAWQKRADDFYNHFKNYL